MIILSNMNSEDQKKVSVTDVMDRRCLVKFIAPGELDERQFKEGQYAITTKKQCIECRLNVACEFYIDPHHQWMGTEVAWGPAWDHDVTHDNLKRAEKIIEEENETD